MKRKHNNAFTLLELMLVLVVVASVLLYASITMRGRSEDKLLDVTAMQIQQILQAASNYYIHQQSLQLQINTRYMYRKAGSAATGQFWPTSLTDLTSISVPDTTSGTTKSYSTGLSVCSSWPQLAVGANICPNNKQGYQIITAVAPKTNVPETSSNYNKNQPTVNTGYFGISLTLPTQALAEKLAARLPFSVTQAYSGQAYTVNTYLPAPGIFYNPIQFKNRGWITSAGILTGSLSTSHAIPSTSRDIKIYMPNCPQGYEGHYILSYMKQRTGHCYQNRYGARKKYTPFVVQHTDIELGYANGNVSGGANNYNVLASLGNNQGTTITPSIGDACNGVTGLAALRDTGYKALYYMTFCIPNGQWKVNTPYCVGDDYFEAEGGQCTTAWQAYNTGGTCPSTS